MRVEMYVSSARSAFKGAIVTAVLVVNLASAEVAKAQGFFNFLFGGQPAPVARPLPPQSHPPLAPLSAGRRAGPLEMAPLESLHRSSRGQPTSLDEAFEPQPRARPMDPEEGAGGGSGSYSTICVRLCDGYYWPLHHATRRRDFQRAARQCEATCGEDSRLFFMPNRGAGGIETAVDLQGRPYSKLPTALVYRKSLINGCACRPSPWSYAEGARHAEYAAAEEQARQAVQAALATDTVAPPGSFRAAQEIGRPKPVARAVVARKRDTGDDADAAAEVAAERVATADRSAGVAPRRPRAIRTLKIAADPDRKPSHSRSGEPRAERRLAAVPAPSSTKPFGIASGSQYKWPGD